MPFFDNMVARVGLGPHPVSSLLISQVKCGDPCVHFTLGRWAKPIVGHLLKTKTYTLPEKQNMRTQLESHKFIKWHLRRYPS